MAAGFMAGFGTTLSELIEKDREYYRAKAEKRKDYLQTYGTKAVVDIEGKANDALAVANQLQNFGFSKEFVTGITAKSGVRGMYDFAQNVLKRTDLTPDDIKELETSAVDFVNSNPEEDLETVINRAYGLYKSESDPVKRKTGMLGAMLGLDARAMEDEVINADYYGGYSGQDLIRIAASSGPKAGKPLGIKLPPKPLSATEYGSVNQVVNSTFDSSLARHIDELGQLVLQGGPEVQAAQKRIDELKAIQTLAKSDPNAAMTTYLRSYDTKGEFLSYLQGLEGGLGRISNNFLLGKDLTATFTALSGDQRDNDIQTITASGQEGTSNTTPRRSEFTARKQEATYTQDQIQEAVNNGDIKVGDTIVVDGTTIEVKQGFINTYKAPKVEEVSSETDTSVNTVPDRSAMEARFQKWIAPLMTPAVDQGLVGMDTIPSDDSWKDSSYLLPADADELSDAVIRGEKVTDFLSRTTDYVNTKGYTYMDVAKAGLSNAMSSVIDFSRGLFGSSKGDSSEAWSRQLQENADLYSERAADIAAMGWKEYMQLNTDDVVPDEVEEEVKSGFLDWFTGPENPIVSLMEMVGVGEEATKTREVNGVPLTNAEIIAAARAKLSGEANARIDAGTNIIEQSREEFKPEFPGDVPDNLENATTASISKSLRFLTEIPERIHQALFDPEDKIDTYVASLFEETLEERIMKNSSDEGYRNRVVALQALKDKISDLRKEAEAEKPNGDTSFEYTDSPVPMEPLVTRPKRTEQPKEMTASDKARLKRAQKANELSGDSGLLNMLVEKYGSVIVQKEMGL
jgi:hypothetical protein